MAVIYKKKLKLGRLLLIILVIALILNIQDIGRFFYPFPHRGLIEKYAVMYNIDPLLIIAIVQQESSFNPMAESKKGARGLMQIMPETGAWIAGKLNMDSFHPDQLYDTETNIHLGSWYLAHLIQEFEGGLPPALAAYNGGQGNVKKWLAEKDWDGEHFSVSQIPFPETRKYVDHVLKNYRIYTYLYSE